MPWDKAFADDAADVARADYLDAENPNSPPPLPVKMRRRIDREKFLQELYKPVD
jgi:hypothetical protein